jgi:hypothetical protein
VESELKKDSDPNIEKINKIKTLRDKSITGWSVAKEQATTVADYLRHKHYTEKEIKTADKFNKPHLRYNLMISKLQTLIGNEQGHRKIAKITGMYNDTDDIYTLLNDIYSYISENERLEQKLELVHTDGMIYPFGGSIRRFIDVDELGYKTIKYGVMDNYKVHFDPDFRMFDLSDCHYIVVDDWMTLSQIKSKYSVNLDDENRNWWDLVETRLDILSLSQNDDNEYRIGDKYLVMELQERFQVDSLLCSVDGSEEYELLTEREIKKLRKSHDIKILRPHEDERIHYTTAIPYFETIVYDDDFPFPTRRFDIFPCFSFNFNMKRSEQTSLFYVLIDIQDRINKGFNQQVDWLTQVLSAGWHVPKTEKDAIKTLKENVPNFVAEYNSINNKAIRENPANIPQDILQTIQIDNQFLNDISNVTSAMEGRSERSSETGVLFDMKLQQSQVSTNPYYEVKALLRQELVDDFCELIPYLYDEDAMTLPVRKDGMLSYSMVNLKMVGTSFNELRSVKARAILDDGDSTKNAKMRAFEENIAFANVMIQSGATFVDIPWHIIIQYSPLQYKKEMIDFVSKRLQITQDQQDNQRAMEELNNLIAVSQAGDQPATPSAGGQ